MNKYVFWWDSPCKGMIGVIQFFCDNLSSESLAITGDLGDFRGSMGWHDKGVYFKNHIVIKRDEYWIDATTKMFDKYKSGYIHVFGGITRNKTEHLVLLAIKENIKFCIMAENPANLNFGIKKIIKDLYIRFYIPVFTRKFANKTQLVFCLCGHKYRFLKYFKQNGYSAEKIVPFGYWTDLHYDEIVNKKIDEKVTLFCPGLLRRYKRVDLLIKAISILKKKGYSNFICHIIGSGEQEDELKSLVKDKNLEDYIVFQGVLDENHDLITKSDLLIAPGSVEPWGIRVNEAIQRGQVVISSEGVGASYLIEESLGGKVFKIGSHKQLADSIQFYLDDFERIANAKKANIQFREKISCEVKAKELFSHLEKIKML